MGGVMRGTDKKRIRNHGCPMGFSGTFVPR